MAGPGLPTWMLPRRPWADNTIYKRLWNAVGGSVPASFVPFEKRPGYMYGMYLRDCLINFPKDLFRNLFQRIFSDTCSNEGSGRRG